MGAVAAEPRAFRFTVERYERMFEAGILANGEVELLEGEIIDRPRTHRFTRESYEQLFDAGIFSVRDRIELLEGEIIEMASQKSLHATGVSLVQIALAPCVGRGFYTRVQLPLAVTYDSQPEPDIAVVKGRPRDYLEAHPQHAVLIVEVADASIAFDRGRKLAAYARAGMPEYWVLDAPARTLEVYREPHADGYAGRILLRSGDRIKPLFARKEVALADLLP